MIRLFVFIGTIVLTALSLKVGVELDVASDLVRKAASYAISSLSELSESEIYKTLSLTNILSARSHNGVFHYNIILELQLSSPYFLSGKPNESFNMIVMTHKEDGSKSFAIDEFPVMKEDAIEKFQIEKIKRKRLEKQSLYRKMEEEALLSGMNLEDVNDDSPFPSDMSAEDIVASLDTPEVRRQLQLDSETGVQPRLSGVFLKEEKALSSMSLLDLFHIVSGLREASTYQLYRSTHILDGLLNRRSRQ